MAPRPRDQLRVAIRAGEVLPHQAFAGGVEGRAAPLRQGRAARIDAPVIEHLRQVQDLAGAALGHPQDEVVVLGAVEPAAQPAQPPQQVQSHREQVVDVVLRQQPLAIEPGLEHRRRPVTLGVDDILVGIDRRRLRPVG